MSSTSPHEPTTKGRILEAAIECFGRHGAADTTARKVAEAAGVSPGLIIHHFGSMEGLRSACDEYVTARIKDLKEQAADRGPGLDVVGMIRESGAGNLLAYLASVLVEDSPAVAGLVDGMVADAEIYMQHFVEAGMMRPTTNPRGRAAVLVIWSLGALVLHDHLERLLGVDLTDPEVTSDPSFASYALPAYEIFGRGVVTAPLSEKIMQAFSDVPQGEDT